MPEPRVLTIHDLPVSERPRERLEQLGPQALSLSELLAVILGRGIDGEPVMQTVQKLLLAFPTLEQLQLASLEELDAIRGIGVAKATQLVACFELARRLNYQVAIAADRYAHARPLISPSLMAQATRRQIKDFHKEHCFVIAFDVRSKLIGVDAVSMGILNANLVHPREVFHAAICRRAASLVLAHNHPSGELAPSDNDLEITRRLVSAGQVMGIELTDHLIVSRNEHFSFREHNLM